MSLVVEVREGGLERKPGYVSNGTHTRVLVPELHGVRGQMALVWSYRKTLGLFFFLASCLA